MFMSRDQAGADTDLRGGHRRTQGGGRAHVLAGRILDLGLTLR